MLDSEFAWVSYDEPWAPDLDSYSGDASPHSAWMAGGTGRRTYKDGAEEQYMIMDLGSIQKVKGVITQPKHQIGVGPGGGRGDEYVLKFVVQYSEDNAVWRDIGVVLHGPEGTGQKGKLSGGEADERVESLFPTFSDRGRCPLCEDCGEGVDVQNLDARRGVDLLESKSLWPACAQVKASCGSGRGVVPDSNISFSQCLYVSTIGHTSFELRPRPALG